MSVDARTLPQVRNAAPRYAAACKNKRTYRERKAPCGGAGKVKVGTDCRVGRSRSPSDTSGIIIAVLNEIMSDSREASIQEYSFSSCVVDSRQVQEMHSPVAGIIFSTTHNLMVEQGIAFWEEFVKRQEERRRTEGLFESSTGDLSQRHSNRGEMSVSSDASSLVNADGVDERCSQSYSNETVLNVLRDQGETRRDASSDKEQVCNSSCQLASQQEVEVLYETNPESELSGHQARSGAKSESELKAREATEDDALPQTAIAPQQHQTNAHKTVSSPNVRASQEERQDAGIGVRLQRVRGATAVVEVAHGGPAHKALRPGDVILAVDGLLSEQLSLEAVLGRLRGPTGTYVHLSVLSKHKSQIPRLVKIRREHLRHTAETKSCSTKTISIDVKSRNAQRDGTAKNEEDASCKITFSKHSVENGHVNCISIDKLQNCLLARLLEGSISLRKQEQEAKDGINEGLAPEKTQERKRMSLTASGFDEDEYEPIDVDQDQKFLELATMTRNVSIQSPCPIERYSIDHSRDKGLAVVADRRKVREVQGSSRDKATDEPSTTTSTKKRKSMEVPRPKDHFLQPYPAKPQHNTKTTTQEENRSLKVTDKKAKKSRIEAWADINLRPQKENKNPQNLNFHSSSQASKDFPTYDSLQQRANQYVNSVQRSPTEALRSIESLLFPSLDESSLPNLALPAPNEGAMKQQVKQRKFDKLSSASSTKSRVSSLASRGDDLSFMDILKTRFIDH
eukprot:759273-Hanusia_phi.AAC.5